MSFAILRERPETLDLKSPSLFERAAVWYLSRFMPANKIPSACISGDVLSHFNSVLHDYSPLGMKVTRFLHFLWSTIPEAKQRYDLGDELDALLFALEVLPLRLGGEPHYRPLFAAILTSGIEQSTFFDACVVAMSDPIETARSAGVSFSSLVALTPPISVSRFTTDASEQDVLLIGHGGSGTGLSRNFNMLAQALNQDGIVLETLDYEREPRQFAEHLRVWREGCRSHPIVVAAVNAQDIPSLFIRDPHGVLDSCFVTGFFLWETSQAPEVQHLGIGLVDEVWTPTKYVADVYAHLASVHIVGKGLFANHEWPPVIRHPSNGTIRFLTVFDFHSSVERKNPWASVAAFHKAFPGGENVELIIKASNVNPQHPGNALGQWEKICDSAAKDKRIRIVTARYSGEQMQQLMRATSCVVSLHRSEGFGYVLSDALAQGIPVIATAYSGNVDFCDPDNSFPVAYRLVPVQSLGAHWEGEESAEWAEPDIDSAAAQMQRVYRDYDDAVRKAAVGRELILAKYSNERFAAALRVRLEEIRRSVRLRTDLLHAAS